MRNQAPRLCNRWIGGRRGLILSLLAVWLVASAVPGLAADRRFAVILAYPAKTFEALDEDPDFAVPPIVKAQYFDTDPDNDIYSLAEWWGEVSYGAVTVSGDTFGWINLPWPIEPVDADDDDEVDSPVNHINLNSSSHYQYGAGEDFAEDPMPVPQFCDWMCDGIPIDYNGDTDEAPFLGLPADAFPTVMRIDPEDCDCCPLDGGPCVAFQFDTDGDSINDSCTSDTGEASDYRPVSTCVSASGAGTCCLQDRCAELCDWGPSGWSCGPNEVTPAECIAKFGLIVEEGEVCVQRCSPCGHQPGDRGSQARGPNIPSMPLRDGIYTPGERFRDLVQSGPDGRYNTLFEPTLADEEGECDYEEGPHLDVDGEGARDLPEPFEDFLRRWDPYGFAGAGDWVKVTKSYIRGNYPQRRSVPDGRDFSGGIPPECADPQTPDCWNEHCVAPACWNVEVAINDFFSFERLDAFTDGCDLRNPTEDDDPVCVYFKQEMFRLRGLGDFCKPINPDCDCYNPDDPNCDHSDRNAVFVLYDDRIGAWTNVDELVWRTGNGVYDPPERFEDTRDPEEEDVRISTKMQHLAQGDDPFSIRVPPPGSYGSFDSVPWYNTFWRARYGTDPPTWAKGFTGRNSPRMEPFDPDEPHPGYEHPVDRDQKRRFEADAGRDDLPPDGENPLAGDIEPDTTVGFYDGWVEHDDLASSKYHAFGDQRLGEVTSPAGDNFDIAGHDLGPHNPNSPPMPDDVNVAAGPLALHIHGNNGLDAGNLLVLEWMTWRTDIDHNRSAVEGKWTPGINWDWEASVLLGRVTHPYAGPASGLGEDVNGDWAPDGWGFRDYNLDGLIDQGEVRPAGSENYKVDSVFGTPNNGTSSAYPFNRRRLVEDCIEVLDYAKDFDLFRDTNTLQKVMGGSIPGVVEGLVSGIVLFPPNAIQNHNGTFPRAPFFYPIHTEDRAKTRRSARFFSPETGGPYEAPVADPTTPNLYSSTLWFHDLPAGMDRGTYAGSGAGGAGGDGGVHYQIRYAAHEYGHTWEGYPDLYDYRRLQPQLGNERYPVGTWCVMADGIRGSGYPAHPVADLKSEYSEWIEPVNLRTELTPGVEREITFANAETSKNRTHFYFDNPLVEADPTHPRAHRSRERFYFWRAGFDGAGFYDSFQPGQGLLILHTDWVANPEGDPPQQHDPFTWNIIQADGDYDLDGGINPGDAGDPFPGSSGTTEWSHGTFPKAHSRWHGDAFSGIEITDIIEAGGGTRVTFEWTPTAVPSLTFVNPPSGSTVDGVYSIAYWAYDLYAGTTLKFYYDTDAEGYNGTLIGSRGKDTPRIREWGTIDWDLDGDDDGEPDVNDGRYFFYCKLVPGVGEEGNTEPAASEVLAGRGNQGTGNLASPTDRNARPVVNLMTSKLEHWTVEYIGGVDKHWSVEGSISGVQQPASTGTLYSSDKGEVQFKIWPDPGKPFVAGDQFTFVTTGKTAYSVGVTVVDGEVVEAPIARIEANPVAGKPPLTVSFDAGRSDENGAPSLDFSWTFGDGSSPATGVKVEHTYEEPGTFSATLKAASTENSDLFGTAEVEIRVENEGPTAVIEYTILTPDGSFPYEVRLSGSESEDPEDLPLEFLWTFDDGRHSTSTEMDPPVHSYYRDDKPGEWYCAEVTLEVTDSDGDTDLARLDNPPLTPGRATPTVAFTMTDSTVEVGQKVDFNAEDLTIEPNNDPNVSYSWDFGDSQTATGLTATHTYDQADTYEVTFTLKYDTNCKPAFSAKRQVRVVETIGSSDGPTAKFTYTVDPESWVTYTFDASESNDPQDGTTGLTYEWDFNDGSDQESTPNPVIVHEFSKTGTFQVQLTVLDKEGNAGVFSQNVTVAPPGGDGGDSDNKPPVAGFTAEPDTGNAPLTVDFASTSSDPDNDTLSHEWDFGDDGETATATANPTHTFVEPGSYTVTLTVTDPEGLSDLASRVVAVRANHAPEARIATVSTEVNAAGELTLDATLSTDPDGDSLTYIWQVFQNHELIDFGSPLTGPILLVQFRNALAACTDVADPCLAPGVYDFVVTVDDGFGGKSVSSATRVTFKPTEAGGQAGDDEAGLGTPDAVPITGHARGGGGGGLCGLGILMPTLLVALTTAATMVARRRRC